MKPEPRSAAGVTSIYNTNKILLFGGSCENSNYTWIYNINKNKWYNKSVSIRPHERKFHGIAPIYGTDKVLLFGGYWGFSKIFNDTWIYDLSENNWTKQNLTLSPSPRKNFGMASIYGTDKILLFGGDGLNDTWIYDLSENN